MENPLLLMAEIAEEMGFLFPAKDSIIRARNKWLMKQSFQEHQVPCSKGVLICNEKNVQLNDLHNLTFPLIIKPLDSYSSRGVYKVNTYEEIRLFIDKSRNFSSNGDIIIEEFMEGPEVSVESITQNEITEIIHITDKVITPYPATVEMAHIQPSNLANEIQDSIKAIVKRAVQSLGLDNCATHSEVKITSQGVKMVEIGARLGGDYITSHLVPLSTGVNIEAAAIQTAMGGNPDIKHKFSKGAVIQYLDLPEGKKISRIGEWNNILKDPNVKHAMLIAKTGDVIPLVTDSAKRMGFVIIQSDTREKAIKNAQENIKKIQDCVLF
jgi:biotin carboxylase